MIHLLNIVASQIARNCNYGRYQRVLERMIKKFFDKKTGSGISVKEQLDEELHKPVIRKFKEEKSMVDLKSCLGSIFS